MAKCRFVVISEPSIVAGTADFDNAPGAGAAAWHFEDVAEPDRLGVGAEHPLMGVENDFDGRFRS